jgi:hypothetical protein
MDLPPRQSWYILVVAVEVKVNRRAKIRVVLFQKNANGRIV